MTAGGRRRTAPRAPLAGAALLAAFAAGCPETETTDPIEDFPSYPPPGDRRALEIGTGDAAFEPFDDGAVVPLVAGPQGGWHLWVSFRAEALLPNERAWFEIEVARADGVVPAQRSRYRFSLFPVAEGPDGWVGVTGWAALVSQPQCFVGEEATLRVLVVDRNGDWAEDTRTLVVGPGTDPPGGACRP